MALSTVPQWSAAFPDAARRVPSRIFSRTLRTPAGSAASSTDTFPSRPAPSADAGASPTAWR